MLQIKATFTILHIIKKQSIFKLRSLLLLQRGRHSDRFKALLVLIALILA
jgi:hypothetical protein